MLDFFDEPGHKNHCIQKLSKMRRTSVLGTLLIANLLMATRLSLTFSRSIPPLLLTRTSCSISNLKQFPKSHPCPLWSSSFSFCLHRLHKSTSPLRASSFSSSPFMAASSPNGVIEDNPLLQNFDFPPFDVVEPKHVRPGIRALLGELVIITSSILFSHFGFSVGIREMGRGWFGFLGLVCMMGIFRFFDRNVNWKIWNEMWNRRGQSWWNRWRR